MPGSFAQEGISPHLSSVPSRSPLSGSSRTASTGCDGAMLYRASSSGILRTPSSSAMTARLVLRVKRPHMGSGPYTVSPTPFVLDAAAPVKTAGTGSQRPSFDLEAKQRRSVWSINTTPGGCDHVAPYPPELVEICVLAS